MTTREAAIDLIKVYVLRGETIAQLKASQQGALLTGYHASIGGFINNKKYNTDHIIVYKVDDKEVNMIFKLKDIYDSILSPQVALL